jgi:hypothetical protein
MKMWQKIEKLNNNLAQYVVLKIIINYKVLVYKYWWINVIIKVDAIINKKIIANGRNLNFHFMRRLKSKLNKCVFIFVD